jgi:hypothetical protein
MFRGLAGLPIGVSSSVVLPHARAIVYSLVPILFNITTEKRY